MELEALRDNLSALDKQILQLVAQRQAMVERIGEVKRQNGQLTRNFAREKQVLDLARSHAAEFGIPPSVAVTLMELLIRSSLTKQEHARVRADGDGHGQRALVIGGGGKMGRWFVDFLDSQGFAVLVADPHNQADGFNQVDDWHLTDDNFDVTVIAAPIGISAIIIDEMAVAGRAGLVFDIGSLKSPLESGLRKMAANGLNVTSLHPMFGPDTELLSGRHVLFLEVGAPEATQQARKLFASTMARQIDMDIAEHDGLIAYVLGLSHALNIAFFTSLAESGEHLPRLADLSSTTFDEQLKVAEKVGAENPQLYFEIQHLNPHGLAPLRALADAVQKIITQVEAGDEAAFVELMQRGSDYLARRR